MNNNFIVYYMLADIIQKMKIAKYHNESHCQKHKSHSRCVTRQKTKHSK